MKIVVLACFIVLSGCSKVIIEKYDGNNYTEGLRFYRPQPYLVVSNILDDQKNPTGNLSLDIKYLPNYQEEYVIRERAWLGTVDMKPTLTDGWNLTALEAPVDTKIPETITALVSAAQLGLPKAARAGSGELEPGFYKIISSNTGEISLKKVEVKVNSK